MKDFEQPIYAKTLGEKKSWYSSVADAYNKARPLYPEEIVDRAITLAKLPSDAVILEVGCGPGTATTSFAKRGFSMVCLEPSEESCQLARQNCAQYPGVDILNTTFEEWQLAVEQERFTTVLSASAFHWVSSKIGYSKAADSLKDDGSLVLLWNTPPQPNHDVSQALSEVYQARAPSLEQPQDMDTRAENLRKLGQAITDSGRFKDLVFEKLRCEVSYSVDDYLALLSTLSPYIALDREQRDSLFEGLKETLKKNCGVSIQTSYLSALHVAHKV